MSQHDFDIANQTASNARTDINNALKALASLSSGTSAPTTTYANMLWYDTANDQIKKRNEADSAWIILGTVSEASGTFSPSASVLPAGAVQVFAMSSAPTGWLSCDGTAVSRSTYSGLYSAIGTTYGSGDGSTTFNLPDLRGEFIRGWDAGRGIDSGRTFGTAQSDAFEAHNHNVSWTAAEGGSGAGSRVENYNAGYNNRVTETVGDANETRPRNIAMLYCIKY